MGQHGVPTLRHSVPTLQHGVPTLRHGVPTLWHGVPTLRHDVPTLRHGVPTPLPGTGKGRLDGDTRDISMTRTIAPTNSDPLSRTLEIR